MNRDATLLTLSTEAAVGFLTINRAGKQNALNCAILEALPRLLREAAEAPALRVLVITGGAGVSFSAGADIDELRALRHDAPASARFCDAFAAAQTAMADFPKPAIAMISGACIGGGCGLALGCDLRIADQTAKFGITPAKLGLDYSIADTKRLVDAVGFAHAADLLFSGRLVGAAEALAMGLVNRLFDPMSLASETMAIAQAIAANAPTSLRSIKSHLKAIRAGQTADDPASRATFLQVFEGRDFAEGLAAFAEKRPAGFTS